MGNNELAIKDNFFDDKRIKKIFNYAGGYKGVVIYMKMMLLSVENLGTIQKDDIAPSIDNYISVMIGEDVEDIRTVLDVCYKINLCFSKGESVFFPDITDNVILN